MSKNELISLIVPCYNVEDYLDKCVECLVGQDYERIEIILVDDGATDSTGAKCDEWAKKDNRIKVIHQENKGLSGARNSGIRAATGTYLSFIDSDDMLDISYVSTLYKCIVDNDVLMAQGRSENFFAESDIDGFVCTDSTMIRDAREACHILMTEYHKGWGIVMTKMFHRSLFEDISFPEGHIHEDEYVVYKLLWKAQRIVYTDKIVYFYRSKRAGSITHSKYSLNRLDVITARKERCEFFKALGEEQLYCDAKLALCQTQLINLELLEKSDLQDKESYAGKIRGEMLSGYREIKKMKAIPFKKKLSLWAGIYAPHVKKALIKGN